VITAKEKSEAGKECGVSKGKMLQFKVEWPRRVS
jgi:hypothetical protein